MGLGIIVGAVVLVLLLIWMMSSEKKRKEESKNAFEDLSDFKADYVYISAPGGASGLSLGFDSQRNKICFLDYLNKPTIYDINKVLQCEIVIDGETVLKHSTTGTIGRTLVGGVLAGGVGAIVGGATGAKSKKEKIKQIDLKIVVDDLANPVYRVQFLAFETTKDDPSYKEKFAEVEKWHSMISGMIIQRNKATDNPVNKYLSVADELKKIKELLDSGVLTEEEFKQQKSKLLS